MGSSYRVQKNKRGLRMLVTVAFLVGATVAAQETAGARLTVDGIAATIGSDADARGVISRVFAHLFSSESNARQRKEFLLASQLRPEWLPAMDRVEFVLLTDAQAVTLIAKCGSYWMVSGVKRTENNVISLQLDHWCAGSVRDYVVSFDGKEWRLGPPGLNGGGWLPGIGSGFVGGPPPGCSCP